MFSRETACRGAGQTTEGMAEPCFCRYEIHLAVGCGNGYITDGALKTIGVTCTMETRRISAVRSCGVEHHYKGATMAIDDKCCTIVPYFGIKAGKIEEFKGLGEAMVAQSQEEPK